jgi:hypothetical protein
MDKAYDLASETYDKAFEAASKLGEQKAAAPADEPAEEAPKSGAR